DLDLVGLRDAAALAELTAEGQRALTRRGRTRRRCGRRRRGRRNSPGRPSQRVGSDRAGPHPVAGPVQHSLLSQANHGPSTQTVLFTYLVAFGESFLAAGTNNPG